MKAAEKKKLREELLQRRRELLASYKRNQEANRRPSDDGPLDLADTATELYTQEFNYSLTENDRQQLVAVNAALERIESGDYGECDDCGEEISEARLRAIPWATLCISCQEKKEAAAKRG